MLEMTLANKALATLIEKTFYPGRCFQLIINSDSCEQDKLAFSVKVESLDEQWLVVSPLENKESLCQVKPGTSVNGLCKNDDGISEYIFNSRLMEIKPYSTPRIFLKRPSELHSSQRRFFRLDVNLPFTCFKGQSKLTGNITNLSAGGLCSLIDDEQMIEPGASLVCQFNLTNVSKPLLLVGKVARAKKTGDKQEIALHFEMLDKNNEDLITNFLFQYQRRQINENRRKSLSIITNPESAPQMPIRYLAG